jgi:hypothetical protein
MVSVGGRLSGQTLQQDRERRSRVRRAEDVGLGT